MIKLILSILILSLPVSLNADFDGGATIAFTAGAKSSLFADIASNPVTLGIAATAFTGYFGYQVFSHFRDRKAKSDYYSKAKDYSNSGGSNNNPEPDDDDKKENGKPSTRELTNEAYKNGYSKTNEFSGPERLYKKGPLYICYDTTCHLGNWCWIQFKMVGKRLIKEFKYDKSMTKVLKKY